MRKLINFLKKNSILVIIVLFATGLRFIAITHTPPSLNWDEVSHGYNAYSILKSGRDEWGDFFPIIFKAYGDYKLPIYIYLTAVSELFFGLNAFAVRLPSVLAGIGTVIFTYFLVKELFLYRGKTLINTQNNSEMVALLSSLLVALEPWSLFLSRGAFEANLALFLIVAGVYFFLRGLRATSYLLPATTLLGLSVWTYNSARIFVPLLIVTLVLLFKEELLRVFKENRKLTSYILILTSLLFLPMFYQLINPIGQARYGKVGIIDDGAIAQIIEARENSSFGPLLTRLIYNRPTYFTQRFVENWGSHFTCSFLFFRGGSHYQFSVTGHGLLYIVNLPFFFLGLLILLKRVLKKDKASLFLLTWLILAPVPSSLTREAPHVLRSIVMIPIPMILSAIGISSLFTFHYSPFTKLRYFLILGYLILLFIYSGNYLQKYFEEYRSLYSWSWQYGYKEVVDYAKHNYDKYDKIIVTKKYGEPHEFFLFFWQWNPRAYQNDPNLIRFNQSNWFWVDRFDKFYFVNDWNIPSQEWESFKLESGESVQCTVDSERCLLITSPGNYPKTWTKLETINFLDGKPAFELYENN